MNGTSNTTISSSKEEEDKEGTCSDAASGTMGFDRSVSDFFNCLRSNI
jgi:hypothetical protein